MQRRESMVVDLASAAYWANNLSSKLKKFGKKAAERRIAADSAEASQSAEAADAMAAMNADTTVTSNPLHNLRTLPEAASDSFVNVNEEDSSAPPPHFFLRSALPQAAAGGVRPRPTALKGKPVMCRKFAARGACEEGAACIFAHSEEELRAWSGATARTRQQRGGGLMAVED